MDVVGTYQRNVDFVKKEFGLDNFTSMYELFNKVTDNYKLLKEKQDQTIKEPENGNRVEIRKRGRPKASN